VAEDAKTDRLHRLQALITRQQRAAQDAMVGKVVNVLFEKPGRFDGQMVGKSEYLHAVHVIGSDASTGNICPVRILSSGTNSLAGEALPAI
jgi:tRNA-2-methylthio-N6-dimethylallyladenosine synthase